MFEIAAQNRFGLNWLGPKLEKTPACFRNPRWSDPESPSRKILNTKHARFSIFWYSGGVFSRFQNFTPGGICLAIFEVVFSCRSSVLLQQIQACNMLCWRPCQTFCIQKRSGDPNPQYFSKSTAVQMGSVLPYKWEAYCSTKMGGVLQGFPFFEA